MKNVLGVRNEDLLLATIRFIKRIASLRTNSHIGATEEVKEHPRNGKA